jgi:effector-binding domain-containing protein
VVTVSEAPVRLVTLDAQPAVAIRVVVPMAELDMGEVFPGALGRLMAYLGEHGPAPAGRPYARYAEFGPERADVEIGFPVAALAADLPALRSDDTLGSTELPGGEAAEYRHVGPYPELGTAYRAIEAWFGASGRSAGGAPWESYEVGFADVGGDASRLETLVLWPLA